MLNTPWKLAIVLACAAALACNGGKVRAEAAAAAAQRAVESARAEAERLLPDDFRSLSDDLDAARGRLAKGDYEAVIASASSIEQKARNVTAKAKAKKDELARSWNELSDRVPKMLDDIETRVDAISSSRKLPDGIDAGRLAGAKEGLVFAQKAWVDAQEAFTSGKWTDAVAQAAAVKDKAAAMMASLHMADDAAPAAATAR